MNSRRCWVSGTAMSLCKETANDRDGAIDSGGVDVQVRRKAQAVQARGQNALAGEMLEQRIRSFPRRAHQVDENDVRLWRLDLNPLDAGQALGQPLAERMV